MEPTVLLVDDEPSVVEGLKRALRGEPYTIIEASSADEALQVLTTTSVDVIVSDEKMPGTSGTELLAQVRLEYPDIMGIILTGYASLEAAIRAINEGEVYRFLTKPVSYADLAITIRHALQQKNLIGEVRRLLRTVKRQSAMIEEAERTNPGITSVRMTSDGAIVVDDDLPQDFDEFMKAVGAQAALAEKKLSSDA